MQTWLLDGVRETLLALALLVILAACAGTSTLSPTSEPSTLAATASPSLAATSTAPPPSSTPTPAPPTLVPSATPSPEPSPTPAGPGLDGSSVLLFPDPPHAGDLVSLLVQPRVPPTVEEPLTVTVDLWGGAVLTAPVLPQGLDARSRAYFLWSWQAPDLAQPVAFTLTLMLSPGTPDADLRDNTLVLPVMLQARDRLPPPEPEVTWAVTETEGFRLYYLTRTAAARDLPALVSEAEAAYAEVAARLGRVDEPLEIYLLDRVIGQGGYASWEWVAVTYTDRAYAPVGLSSVLRHELVHRLDGAVGCGQAPALVREGLAVYVAGGHYRPEPLPRRAAALLRTAHYVPLTELVTAFYTHQHEAGYLEAGAVLGYVVDRWGWEGVGTLCRASGGEGDDAARLARGVAALGVEDLASFEADWLAWLRASVAGASLAQDVALLEAELRLMDALRAYQRAYNPGAHFLDGILFDPAWAEERGLEADFVRRPRDPEAVTLELLLASAQAAIRSGDAARVTALLAEIEPVLQTGRFDSGRAADWLPLVRVLLERGYEPVQVAQDGPGAYIFEALDYAAWPERRWFVAAWDGTAWALTGPLFEAVD